MNGTVNGTVNESATPEQGLDGQPVESSFVWPSLLTVALMLIIWLVAVIVLSTVGAILGAVGGLSGEGNFLLITFLVFPAAAIVSLFPSALLAVTALNRRGRWVLSSPMGAALVVTITLLATTTLVAVTAWAADSIEPRPQANALLPMLGISLPFFSAGALWAFWSSGIDRHRARTVTLGFGIGLAALVAVIAAPAVLLRFDPYRNLTPGTISNDALQAEEWRIKTVLDDAPKSLRIRLESETGDWPGVIQITMRPEAPARICTDWGDPCQPAGRTAQGWEVRTYDACTAAAFDSRPDLLIKAPKGVWLVDQIARGSTCGDLHPDFSVEELVALVDGFVVPDAGSFQAWAADVDADEN